MILSCTVDLVSNDADQPIPLRLGIYAKETLGLKEFNPPSWGHYSLSLLSLAPEPLNFLKNEAQSRGV
jgi:hypothetical protein